MNGNGHSVSNFMVKLRILAVKGLKKKREKIKRANLSILKISLIGFCHEALHIVS